MGNKWKQSNNFKLIQRFFAQATPQAEKPVASERPGGEGKEERGELPGVAVVEAIAWTPPPEFLEPNYLLFFARLVAGFLFLQLSEIMAEVSFLEVTAQLPHSEETHRRGALFASAVYLLGWLVSRQVIFFNSPSLVSLASRALPPIITIHKDVLLCTAVCELLSFLSLQNLVNAMWFHTIDFKTLVDSKVHRQFRQVQHTRAALHQQQQQQQDQLQQQQQRNETGSGSGSGQSGRA